MFPHDVAALLKRPAEELLELDRRPLVFAFVEGRYEQVVLRDHVSGEVFEVTVSEDGQLVDVGALQARNRSAAAEQAAVLDEGLRSLLLRHPELPGVRVRVSRAADAGGRSEPEEALLSPQEIAALADDATVTRVALLEDPVILDED